MKTPCDELYIQPQNSRSSCVESSGPWILAATILGSSMAFIDGTIVNVAAPKFQSAFHATVVDVQWVIESYGLFLSSLILAGGALGDRLGRRFVFLIGVAIFAAASACLRPRAEHSIPHYRARLPGHGSGFAGPRKPRHHQRLL
jgi:fucose permease